MIDIYLLLNESTICLNTTIAYSSCSLLGASIKSYHRLVYFEKSRKEIHYIDFVPYKIEAQTFYIIPSGHFYYLPYSVTNGHCIELPAGSLTLLQKQTLFKFKYSSNKLFKVDLQYFEKIISLSPNLTVFSILEQIIKERKIAIKTPNYMETAKVLVQFISKRTAANRLSVKRLADELCISEKTLLRLCNEVFNQTPKFILRYHLFVLSVTYILYFPARSFSEISLLLGFSETATFNRYIKSVSGQCPREIRQLYSSLLLP